MNKKINAALISIVSNSLLILLKIIVGIYTGAISIISEAIHSSIDLCASIIAYFAVKKSSTPPDINHQYGHQKIENISGFTEAILIFIAAIWIILEAIKKIIYPTPLEMIGIGIVIMLFSSILNIYISKILFKVSAETLSVALKADAIHLMSDVYTSFAVMTGLVFIWLGKKLFPFYNFYWIDPAFAIIVSIMIIKAGWKLTKESVYDLIDTAASENEINKINNIIKNFDNVISFKN
ncbi:MAG: cation diffusion facilitator family transporter, partial [Elusimicrobiales bacterium]|nr:cation diffusion facilitator family transporter [Elusimicrobiales bacterium]